MITRYTTPDGKDIVVNIQAKEGNTFIRIHDAKEYFYGTDPRESGAQRGVYNRDFIGLRIENVSDENIKLLHQYVEELLANKDDHFRFNLFFGPILNLPRLFNKNLPEYGNCSRWCSAMLLRCHLTTNYNVWPKTVFINIFENYAKTDVKTLDNMSVVYYEQPQHVETLAYGSKNKISWWFDNIAPFQLFRNFFYRDLKQYSNCVVRIKPGSMHAVVIENPDPIQPSEWRNIVNSKYFIAGSVIGSLYLYRKSYVLLRQKFQSFRRWTKGRSRTSQKE